MTGLRFAPVLQRWLPQRGRCLTQATHLRRRCLPLLRHHSQSAAAVVQTSHSDGDWFTSQGAAKDKWRGGARIEKHKPSRRSTKTISRPTVHSMKRKEFQHVGFLDPKTLSLPARDEIQGMPQALLEDPLSTLSKRLRRRSGAGVKMRTQKTKGAYLTTVTISLPGHMDFTAGEYGITGSKAQKAAGLKIVADLHAVGLVKELWPFENLSKNYDGDTDALIDVYNYCSMLMAVPKVEVIEFQPLAPASPKARAFKYVISLEEQGILVSATGPDFTLAMISAAINFKTAAETYIASSRTSEPVKSSRCLNTENAAMFHEWLRMENRYYDYKFNSTDHGEYRESQLLVRNDSDGQMELSGPSIMCGKTKKYDNVAYLSAAICEVRKDPSLKEGFFLALKNGNGKILRRAPTVELELSQNLLTLMRRTTSSAHASGLNLRTDIQLKPVEEPEQQQRSGRPPLTMFAKKTISQTLAKTYQKYLNSDTMAAMRKLKSELPMNQYKKQVFQLVQDNVYSIIIGATGSGKTTQVPQIILEQYYQNGNGAECEIICTQPRRIAATSVASRVKDELGPDLRAHVGHHVRFDPQLPQQGGSLTYCTTGILLQQLQAEPDRVLDRVSHLIIDEVHERDKIIDFTLTVLKKLVTERLACGKKVPRITLMSATLDTELFANYFKNMAQDGTQINAPILSVPGRTFPVTERYLDDILTDLRTTYTKQQMDIVAKDKFTVDYIKHEHSNSSPITNSNVVSHQQSNIAALIDWKTKQRIGDNKVDATSSGDALIPYGLVAATIAHVIRTTTDGAILVFLPGLQEIQHVEKLLRNCVLGVDLRDTSKFKMFLLHSSIPDTQKSVFGPVPKGVRKIILSTNIGETSITIPDVKHVIDTGKVRETNYDHVKRISSLGTVWISKSNAKQRAGRAGRVHNGHYLALYSRERHQSMRAIGLPELLRTDLQTTCLTVKSTLRGFDIREFLAGAIEAPSPAGVEEAVNNLTRIGAFTEEEELTALGRVLASLPIHPTLGKMVVLGVLFKCLDPILVLGAAAEERGLFIMAPEAKAMTLQVKKSFLNDTQSDHMVTYNAFSAVRKLFSDRDNRPAQDFAWNNNIHLGAWKSIHGSAQQMEQILTEHGLVPSVRSTNSRIRSNLFGGPSLNVHSDKPHIVKAILLAGLLPNVAVTRKIGLPWRTTHEQNTILPRTSALVNLPGQVDQSRVGGHLATFTNLMKSVDGKSIFLREVSVLEPLAVALFANDLVRGSQGQNLLKALGWLPLYISSPERGAASTLLNLRRVLDRIQTDAFADLARGQPLHGTDKASLAREDVVENVVEILDLVATYQDNALSSKEFVSVPQAVRGKERHVPERFGTRIMRHATVLPALTGREPLSPLDEKFARPSKSRNLGVSAWSRQALRRDSM
jgi:ATP-dependent RNA helicase DHX36